MSRAHQQNLAALRQRAERRILLAEDNPVNRVIAQHQLLELGYPVDAVENGRAALEALSDRPYDLVLMDCQMPELDGYETTRRIRLMSGALGRIPVVALTAHDLEGDRERCFEAGMNDYLQKPFEKAELASILDGHLLIELPEPEKEPPRPPPEESGDLLDPEALDALRAFGRGGGDDVLGDLVAGLIDPQLLRGLEQNLADGDAEGLAKTAHGLKGSLGFVGARSLAARYAELEHAAREGDLERCAHLLETLTPEHRQVETALRGEFSL